MKTLHFCTTEQSKTLVPGKNAVAFVLGPNLLKRTERKFSAIERCPLDVPFDNIDAFNFRIFLEETLSFSRLYVIAEDDRLTKAVFAAICDAFRTTPIPKRTLHPSVKNYYTLLRAELMCISDKQLAYFENQLADFFASLCPSSIGNGD